MFESVDDPIAAITSRSLQIDSASAPQRADPDQRLHAVLVDQLVGVDRRRRHAHAGALHRDRDALVRAGEAEHVAHRRVAVGVLEEGLRDPLGPQRVARHAGPARRSRPASRRCAYSWRRSCQAGRTADRRPATATPGGPVTYSAVVCPSGLRSTPRKRVRVQALRGFKSLRHRSEHAKRPVDPRGSTGVFASELARRRRRRARCRS